jgi:hypothetical protein
MEFALYKSAPFRIKTTIKGTLGVDLLSLGVPFRLMR